MPRRNASGHGNEGKTTLIMYNVFIFAYFIRLINAFSFDRDKLYTCRLTPKTYRGFPAYFTENYSGKKTSLRFFYCNFHKLIFIA